MKDNALRRILQSGKPAFGTMLQELRSPAVPILLGDVGFDFLFIDMEHGAFNMETVADLLKVIRLTGLTALVRVPDLQYHLIARCLDAGAQGVMVPRIETREQVERVVRFCKYPPVGERGCSVNKGHNDYRGEPVLQFVEKANQENLVILQIERKTAIEHVDDLFSVPGVDAAILGPNDLAVDLGVGNDLASETMVELLQAVVDAGIRHNVYTGMHVGNLEALELWMTKGMRIIAYNTDLGYLKLASSQGLAKLRQAADRLYS